MQPHGFHGLPPRPNLPPNPYANTNTNHAPVPTRAPPASVPSIAQTVAAALANPHAQQHSSHYAQAYAQYYNNAPAYSPQGYAYSSIYDPQAQTIAGPSSGHSAFQNNGRGSRGQGQHQQQANWYAPGGSRCTYYGCMFAGSAKAVEVHMMDRHLIYPPGWDKRKRDDWDADPSLKGCVSSSVPLFYARCSLRTAPRVMHRSEFN